MKTFFALLGLMWVVFLATACEPFNQSTQASATARVDQTPTVRPRETLVSITPGTVPVTPAIIPTRTGLPTLTPTNLALPTATPVNTPIPSLTFTPTLTPTNTPTFTPTPRVIPCNMAAFVSDVTIPDGTLVDAGTTFTKIWRLRNSGTCTWAPNYKVVFVSGDQLGGPDYILLGTPVAPGQTIDISLVLIAPETSGTYRGFYQLADADGNLFGIGASGNTFFVAIRQNTPSTPPDNRVSLSTTRAPAGNKVTVYVSGFPANSEIDYRVGKLGENYSRLYDGHVGADGTTQTIITIPDNAVKGEYWVVEVLTTSLIDGISVLSHTIYISDIPQTPYPGDLQVNLSATQAHAGDEITVYVRGFPSNAEIDFRVGKQGDEARFVYDGTVGLNGSTIQVITIPANAVKGEYWVVRVTTTNLDEVVSVTSRTIFIIQ